MQQRNEAELLTDILRHVRLAEEYLPNAEAFAAESKSRRAVERCLQIVGEAVTQLLALDVDYLRFISDARRIIAFRHLLTHHYYRVSPILLHEIVIRSLRS
ncbi:MAG: HepT-like ribonuclease domain-containing protein [Janthinobacterium lividum]